MEALTNPKAGALLCRCKFASPAKMYISKTSANPNRCFWCCSNWRKNGCNMFKWFDGDDDMDDGKLEEPDGFEAVGGNTNFTTFEGKIKKFLGGIRGFRDLGRKMDEMIAETGGLRKEMEKAMVVFNKSVRYVRLVLMGVLFGFILEKMN